MLNRTITQQINYSKIILLTLMGSMFFIQTNAQRPDRGRGEPRVNSQQAPRQQNPGGISRQEPRTVNPGSNRPDRPRHSQQQPHVNNNPRTDPPAQRPGYNRPDRNNPSPRVNRNPNSPRSNNGTTYNNQSRFRPVQSSRRPSQYWPHRTYNAYNPGWRYSNLPRRNAIITSFAFPYQTINYGGFGYRYCDGIYYRPYNNVFRVVAPPFGIFINILPFGYRRIVVHDNPYYYYNGTYYDDYESNYRVVAPPVGAVVESIPEGYETIVIDGETYYKVDDVQYKPVVQDNGEIWYEVIKVG